MAANPKPNPKPQPANFSVEQSHERIEALVREMEEGRLPLDEVINRFEEGAALVKQCQEKLAAAGERIQLILRNAGEPSGLADFAASEE